jgi:septal ring factor EnvC (AmiA/AmiB activator)
MRLYRIIFLSIMAVAWIAGAAGGGENTSPPAGASLENLRREAETVQRSIQEHEAEIDRISRRESDVLNALERTAQTLHRHRRQALALKAELEELDQKTTSTRMAEEDLIRRIRANEAYLAKRLVALYSIQRLGTVDVLAASASMVEAVKRKAALECILSHDEEVQKTLRAYYAELRELQPRLASQQAEKQARAVDYDRQLAAVNREQSNREKLLARIRSDKAFQLAAVGDLQDAARALDLKMKALTRSFDSSAGEPLAPVRPITASKGLLIFPVKGKIVNSYGPYRHPRLNVHAFRNGIDIAAERGEPVKAVHAGTILYSGWFKGYGSVIIIDHGDHFYSVYAHLEDIFKSVENRVEAGDVIATAGDSGAMGATGIYFELRHHDRPLNPMEWLQPG